MAYRRTIKLKPVKRDCPFCKENRNPDYKDVAQLRKYISERGRLYAKTRTGLCNKHQKRVATQVKRARHLAYLPFVAEL